MAGLPQKLIAVLAASEALGSGTQLGRTPRRPLA